MAPLPDGKASAVIGDHNHLTVAEAAATSTWTRTSLLYGRSSRWSSQTGDRWPAWIATPKAAGFRAQPVSVHVAFGAGCDRPGAFVHVVGDRLTLATLAPDNDPRLLPLRARISTSTLAANLSRVSS
jgi:hypothetical protein